MMDRSDSFMFTARTRPWLLSLVCTFFVIYPTAAWQFCAFIYCHEPVSAQNVGFFVLRFVYHWAFFWFLLNYNLRREWESFSVRLLYSFGISTLAFGLYFFLGWLIGMPYIPVSMMTFQFFAACLICVFIGYIYYLFDKQRKREQELEQLQINSLESQLNALSNQINPHFFFNSLNGMSALIRKNDKEKSLLYVNKLSDIFRYILQSEHRGLVTLREELAFVDAYRHVLVVRFANKLDFKIDVDEQWLDYQLPVLSLLPLVENVSVHNIIDSEHHMTVHIFTNEKGELVVSNKLMPKPNPPLTNGSGIANLSARYHLLMGKDVKVEEVDGMFQVIAPLQPKPHPQPLSEGRGE